MTRSRTSFRLTASALMVCFAAPLAAQTSTVNPQAPKRSVDRVIPDAEIDRHAQRIDRLLEGGLRRHQQEPNAVVDDATFLRRSYLTIVGRIPTLQETEAFLADQAPDKRAQLTDGLLDSAGRTSHFANWWFDILRVRSRSRRLSGEPFAHYIRESIQSDKPYDEFVREMVTATGAAHQRGNGATGLLMRDMNMPHDSMANTLARVHRDPPRVCAVSQPPARHLDAAGFLRHGRVLRRHPLPRRRAAHAAARRA